jgi:hypothetical protein
MLRIILAALVFCGPAWGQSVRSPVRVGTTAGTVAAGNDARIPANIKDFGAICDGTTDDSASITAAIASGKRISVPAGAVCNAAGIGYTSLTGVFLGPGQIKTSDGYLRAPLVSSLSTARASLGNWASDQTSWTGDLSGIGIPHEHIVTGAATLGQPTSGYTQIIEASGAVEATYNTSGYNFSLSGNGGRTGLAGRYMIANQYGQGDLTAMQCGGVVASAKAGATSYLSSPALECLAGGLFGGANGAYIEWLGDMNITDNGYDIAAVGAVWNLNRSNATGGIGANWIGTRINGGGTKPIDIAHQVSGNVVVGLDMSQATMAYSRLAGVTVSSGGSGYVVGDLLTVSGGTSVSPTILKVATLSGSAIATVSIVNTGIYTTAPVTGYNTLTLTGGTGTSAVIAGQYAANTVLLPQAGGCMQPGGAGNPDDVLQGVNAARLCIYPWGMEATSAVTTGNNGGALGANNFRFGAYHNTLGTNNFLTGQFVYDRAQINSSFFSSGTYAGKNAGFAQEQKVAFRGTTSSGVPSLRLTADRGAANTQNSLLVQANEAAALLYTCIAHDVTTTTNNASWVGRKGFVSRGAGSIAAYQGDGSSALVPDYGSGTFSTASITVTSDTSLQNINVTFANPISNTDAWDVQCMMTMTTTQ